MVLPEGERDGLASALAQLRCGHRWAGAVLLHDLCGEWGRAQVGKLKAGLDASVVDAIEERLREGGTEG